MKNNNYLPVVRKHYEEYPYPERNPEDEKNRLVAVGIDSLDVINHYSHEGKKNFLKGIRVLIAGGGTGDSTIFLAEQLRDTKSEIIYVDMSEASMKIAQERASIRGLTNITWIHDSLLNIPMLGLGKFDHISCTGVLHHLEDPVAGIKALESVLSDNGSINIMVYAHYGRTSVYQVQDLMRMINHNETSMNNEISNCRKVLKGLSATHWHKLANMHEEDLPDIELYDLYLHSQDRAYTVPELYEFAESANLKLIKLLGLGVVGGNDIYNPDIYIEDEGMRASLKKLNLMQRQAAAEILNGRILMHSFNLTKKIVKQPDASMLDYVPSLSIICANNSYEMVSQIMLMPGSAVQLNIQSINLNLEFRKTPNIESFFRYMNGERSLKSIYSKIMAEKKFGIEKITRNSLIQEFKPVIKEMSSHNLLFLRHKSVQRYKTTEDLDKR